MPADHLLSGYEARERKNVCRSTVRYVRRDARRFRFHTDAKGRSPGVIAQIGMDDLHLYALLCRLDLPSVRFNKGIPPNQLENFNIV